ncbi:hypothetical protein NN561_006303 [Cricetulus griseus]
MAEVSGPSRCGSGRGSTILDPDARGSCVRCRLLLQLPPSSCSSHTLLSDTAAPPRPPQLRAHGCDLRLQAGAVQAKDSFWPGTSSSAGPPRLLRVASVPREVSTPREPATRPFPPAGPTSCATVAGRPGGEERRACALELQSFSSARSSRNKREGGAEREQHVGGGGAATSRTLVTFSRSHSRAPLFLFF